MIEAKKPPNVGGQAEQLKLERDIQQAKVSQASPAPSHCSPRSLEESHSSATERSATDVHIPVVATNAMKK